MEEIEVPTEHLHETILERAEESLEKDKEKSWSMSIAISTALMAVFAAIAGLMAGHHSNEALIEQLKASDQWAYYQAKGIKAEIKSLQAGTDSAATRAVRTYKTEQADIKKEAEADQALSTEHLGKHVHLAGAVTLFQMAIAISAIAILTRKKLLWFIAIVISGVALVFFVLGLI